MQNQMEHQSSRVGSRERALRLMATTAIVSVAALGMASGAHAQALPQGGNVVAGSATITQTSATRLDILQSTNRAVINWDSFNIGAGNRVNIAQPSASSMSIQQVIGTSPSQIFGTLTSNGQVVVANPNGIYMGPGALVDVAGIVATTGRMSAPNAQAFVAGAAPLVLDVAGRSDASVVNAGTITVADKGLAALVAPGVRNSGLIQARLGEVRLASANRATLDFWGDGLVSFAITEQSSVGAKGPDGQALDSSIVNDGILRAAGGRVLLTSSAAQNVIDSAINMSGLIDARSASVTQQGTVVLDGGAGTTLVSGTIDASGRDAGQKGGNVNVLGKRIGLLANATIDAAGANGGGEVNVGGNYKGQGPLPHADAVVMAGTAKIDASAVNDGNGGRVILWSDQYTSFQGTIKARGGAAGGNGGFVETSSKDNLQVQTGSVDATATAGSNGTWLLDPRNVFIEDTATAGGAFDGGSPNIFTPTADDAIVYATTINAALNAGTSVTIATTGSGGTQAGDVTVNANILKTTGALATLLINATGAFNNTAAISGAGTAGLTLVVNTTNGGVIFGAAINTGNGGSLSVDSHGGAVTQTADITVGGATAINAYANAIDLSRAGNNFQNYVFISNTGNNNVNVRTSGYLDMLQASFGSGTVTLTAGTGMQTRAASTFTQATGGGAVTMTTTSGDILMNNDGNNFAGVVNASARDVILADTNNILLGNITSNRNLAIRAGGPISQNAGSPIVVAGTASFSAGAAAIQLFNTNNAFTGAVSLSNSGNNIVEVVNSYGLVLGTVSVGTGTFSANGSNGITQTGSFRQAAGAGTASFTTGPADIVLTNAQNDFTGAVNLSITGVHNASIVDANSMNLNSATVGGDLTVTVHGTLTEGPGVTVGGIYTKHILPPPSTATTTGGTAGTANVQESANAAARVALTPVPPVSGNATAEFANPVLVSASGTVQPGASFGQIAAAAAASQQGLSAGSVVPGEGSIRSAAFRSTELANFFVNSGWLGRRGAAR